MLKNKAKRKVYDIGNDRESRGKYIAQDGFKS